MLKKLKQQLFVSKTDIDTANTLASVISKLDQAVFPENPINQVEIYPESNNLEAYYCKDDTQYGVFAKGLANKIKYRTSSDQGLVKPGAELSIEDACLMIAAHEIRHRLQYKENIIQFSMSYAKKGPKKWYSKKTEKYFLLAFILNFCYSYFADLKQDLQDKEYSQSLIKIATSTEEFDAMVIEYYVINEAFGRFKFRLKDFTEVIRLQPPKIN